MKLDRFVRHLAAGTQDGKKLRAIGEMVGNELPRNRLETLRQVRAELAKRSSPQESFAAGYVTAIADVVAAYEAAVAHKQDVRQGSELLLTSGAREVLSALAAGIKLPSAISDHTGRSAESVSRTLNQLRAAGLALQIEPLPAGDKRSRPHSLTDFGAQLAAQLPRVLAPEALNGVTFAVRAMAHLARRVECRLTSLEELAATVFGATGLAKPATEHFVECARAERLVSAQAGAVSLLRTAPDQRALIADALERATRDNQSRFWDVLSRLVTDDRPLFVRPSVRSRRQWLVLAMTKLHAIGKIRLINDPKLDFIDPGERYGLLYDDVTNLEKDIEDPEVAKLVSRSERTVVIASPEKTARSRGMPKDVEELALESIL